MKEIRVLYSWHVYILGEREIIKVAHIRKGKDK